jgi:hypothetical protein
MEAARYSLRELTKTGIEGVFGGNAVRVYTLAV